MNLLALDLATRCGWALLENGRLESGTDTFDVKRGESPGTRYLRFNRWLDEFALHPSAGLPRVELIVFEQAHQRGGAATEVAAGFSTRVMEFCAKHGIEHASVHTASLKKWTTGKGNADKAAMLEAVARRWKRVDTDDEADAVALLYYALAELVPVVPSPTFGGQPISWPTARQISKDGP
jgi:Holliday junction resolvasome RuvABC endonuclease subunit